MDEDLDNEADTKRRERLMGQLDRMVASGRVTGQEARRLREARGPRQFDQAVRQISARHAGTRLDAAVADGSLSPEEAEGFVDRLLNGEHSHSLRAHLGKLRPGVRSAQASGSARARQGGQEDYSA